MKDDLKATNSKVGLSIILGSLIISTGIMASSDTGLASLAKLHTFTWSYIKVAWPYIAVIGVLLTILVAPAFLGAGLAKLKNKIQSVLYYIKGFRTSE